MSQPQHPQLSTVQVDAVIAEFEELTDLLRSRCLTLRARSAVAEQERDALKEQVERQMAGHIRASTAPASEPGIQA